MTADERPSLHALLIGIDGYRTNQPSGCVNGVLWLEEQLARIPGASVRRVISPGRNSPVKLKSGEKTASIANLQAALADLLKVQRGERVFIYYSGHSARVRFQNKQGRTYFREGWLPDNFDATPRRQILFDFHLNQFLAQLAAITPCITMMIDSCYSAGATRNLEDTNLVPLSRVIDGGECVDPSTDGVGHGLGHSHGVDVCNVAAASLAHEAAHEGGVEGDRGGVFTRALVEALRGIPDDEMLTVRWSRIWQGLCDEVLARTGTQHPWMSDSTARAVFGGRPVNVDAGFSVLRCSPSEYVIRAGSLAGVTRGARVAVYGDQPARFPAIGSAADLDAHGKRILEVTCSGRSTALARPVAESFEPPPGARARVIAAGDAARIRCCVVPRDERLEKALAASPLLEVVDGDPAQVRIEKRDNTWAIMDDEHGSAEVSHALWTFTDRDDARPLLEHYVRYSLPLRMATMCTDLRSALELTLLAVPEEKRLTREAQDAAFEELPHSVANLYRLRTGGRLCMRIHNGADVHLKVTLLNCAGSGKVELLGEQSIAPAAVHTFWAGGTINNGFTPTIPGTRRQILDRLVAIGRTAMETDLSFLIVDKGFADVLQTSRGGPEAKGDPTQPVDRWTAVSARLLLTAS